MIFTEAEEEGALLPSHILFLAEDLKSKGWLWFWFLLCVFLCAVGFFFFGCVLAFFCLPMVDTAKASSFADASLVRTSLRALFQKLKYWATISLTFSPERFFVLDWIPMSANETVLCMKKCSLFC